MADLLLVDDDAEALELMADLFRDEGHQVWVAHDGREGMALLEARRPDLAVLDVEMPVLTGPEMAHAMSVRAHGLETIPVVLLSGVLDLKQVAAGVGTPYFLAKPCTAERIRALVAKALVERIPPHSHSTG